MYLIHNTTSHGLKSILKDGCLKSFSLLDEKEKKKSAGEGGNSLYTKNHFVYFSCTEKLFEENTYACIILYFNSKLLFNKSFYVATGHSSSPDILEEGKTEYDEKNIPYKKYKRKYNRYYKKYDIVLKKLYDNSINALNGRAFQIFQQIAIRNTVNLDELVGIEFKHISIINNSIINYINKYYPNIMIKI